MTFDKLKQNVKDDKYKPPRIEIPAKLPENHVFDENLTIKENRERLAQYNKARTDAFARNRVEENNAFRRFQNDLEVALIDEFGINLQQANKIVDVAYGESHSEGYLEVARTAYDIAGLYKDLQKLAG